MKATYQFSLRRKSLPELHPCPNCGHSAEVFFSSEPTTGASTPVVFIHCSRCHYHLSSEQLLGDLSWTPALEKYSRIIDVWNQLGRYSTR